MAGTTRIIRVSTAGAGLRDITQEVVRAVEEAGISEGLCTLFIRHTSASLLIQENADPDVRRDLERWLARLVPENDPIYSHTIEGPDDMPAHIKAALTAVSLSIPIMRGSPVLGRWQGIYLWEHRRARHEREIAVHIG